MAVKQPKVAKPVVNNFKSGFDTQGSYTGTVLNDKFERPIQDADDL